MKKRNSTKWDEQEVQILQNNTTTSPSEIKKRYLPLKSVDAILSKLYQITKNSEVS